MNNPSPISRRAAFSLIEMLITVALLAFIVVGLMAMFVQTQKAFRGGIAQTDVLEAGRAVTDLLARELEQTSPSQLAGYTNFFAKPNKSTAQSLPGGSASRTNVLSYFFFLTRNNLDWSGIGYVVSPASEGVGTLYRYETNAPSSRLPGVNSFLNANSSALHRVADGIVHFQIEAYDRNGIRITSQNTNGIYAAPLLNSVEYSFTGNAVPAYLELELGVLEYQTLKKLQALPAAGTVREVYLAREQTAGRVHIFRRHITIRNVDPEAYP